MLHFSFLSRALPTPHRPHEMSRKENALELGKLVDKVVRVKLSGGREGERERGSVLL
jgi:hypothetical protein